MVSMFSLLALLAVSRLHHRSAHEVQVSTETNMSKIPQNTLISEREWSAQEVRFILLGLNNSSEKVHFVDCRPPGGSVHSICCGSEDGAATPGQIIIQKYMDCPDSWREKVYFWLTRVNDQKKERHMQDPYYVSHSSKTYDADQQPEDYANVKLYTTRLCVYRT